MDRSRTIGIGAFGLTSFLLLLVASCGYGASGTWNDEDENWERAFGAELPDGVELVHSHFWRGAHFTHEAVYYFELAPNAEFERELTRSGEYELHFSWSDSEPVAPSWFSPAVAVDDFEIWVPVGAEFDGSRVYIERETRRIFLHDSQL